ncbi:MAG: hypothetical protein AB1847_12630 [bacterium]
MIPYPVPYLLIFITVAALVIDTRKGILIALIVRPIIDACWPYRYGLLGIRPPEIIGVVFPVLVFFKIITSEDQSFFDAPLSWIWIVYIYYQLFSAVMILTTGNGFMDALNFFMRAFNGFIGYYLFQEFFHEHDHFKWLLTALLLSSFFPLATSVYQNILGGTIRIEETVGGLVRNIGFYHDAFTLRLYSLQTITAALLYWVYFLDKKNKYFIVKGSLLSTGLLCVITIYRLYSKAGYFILAGWFIVWCFLRKNFLALAALAIILTAFSLTNVKWTQTIGTVFLKETGALKGDVELDQTFQGRWYGWKSNLNRWIDAPIYLKLIGDGSASTGMHNDFLRALFGTGVIGLLIYLILLGATGIKILGKFRGEINPLIIMALMLYMMWWIDALGLVPGAYTSYQWYAWGFIGLALREVKGFPVAVKADQQQCSHIFQPDGHEHSIR